MLYLCSKIGHIYFLLSANLRYCKDPGNISNGNRDIRHAADDFYFGTIVTFTCDSGFELKGAPSIQCLLGYKRNEVAWNDSSPECLGEISFKE